MSKDKHNEKPTHVAQAPVVEKEPVAQEAPVTEEQAQETTEALQAPVETQEPTQAPEAQPVVEAKVTETNAVQAPVKAAEAISSVKVPEGVPAHAAEDYAKLSMNSQMTVGRVLSYVKEMAPNKPMSPTDGARHQVVLYRTIFAGLNNAADDFHALMNVLLAIFDANAKGAFEERHALRFMESVGLEEKERGMFCMLITSLRTLAPVKSRRQVLKQINLEHVASKISGSSGLRPDARERFIGYFAA